jgi:uroporphyrinogen-III synthase
MSFRVLSTKLLSPAQQQLMLNASIAFVHANFIETSPLDFTSEPYIENAIFTSKNALKAIENKHIKIKNVFCVGLKTSELAKAKNINVLVIANTADKLADIILKKHSNKEFTFFCGESRLGKLPDKLRKNAIKLQEIVVYATKKTPKLFAGSYDGVLFFSPSAVESYMQLNSLEKSIAFCIGETTAKEASKYTDQLIKANSPSVENVLVQVIKYVKQQVN